MTGRSEPLTRRVGMMTLTLLSDLEVELSRVFDAPRALVFEAHSKPEHVKRWWGLRRSTMTECEMDFRPGGRWRYVLREAGGQTYAFSGEYREIVPPERLSYSFTFEAIPDETSFETLTFSEEDGRTTITTVSVFSSKAARDAMIASGMESGAAETWDRLAECLEALR